MFSSLSAIDEIMVFSHMEEGHCGGLGAGESGLAVIRA
jgi:hypothetical protein